MYYENKDVIKSLRSYVVSLCKEHKRLEREIERNTRCAPPFGATLKYVNQCGRKIEAIEKTMNQLGTIVDRCPTSPYNHG